VVRIARTDRAEIVSSINVTTEASTPSVGRYGSLNALHVLIDSTGLQVYGAGQWLKAKHGAKSRRKWRKLHLLVDSASGVDRGANPAGSGRRHGGVESCF
jgi:Transposase DDE domain